MKINIQQFAQNCHSRFHIREIKEKLSYQNMFIYRNRQNTFRNLNIMRSERAIKNPRPLTAEMGGTLSALWRQRNFNHFTPRLLSNKLLLIFWFPSRKWLVLHLPRSALCAPQNTASNLLFPLFHRLLCGPNSCDSLFRS